MKLTCDGAAKQVSAGVGLCFIESQNWPGNVESGLEMLFSSATLLWMLVMNHGRLVVLFSDCLTL